MYLFILNIGSVSTRKSQQEARNKCWIGKLEFTIKFSFLFKKNKNLLFFPLKLVKIFSFKQMIKNPKLSICFPSTWTLRKLAN